MASAVSVEGKYTFTDRQPMCYTGMDQSLGERAHEDARMGWIQESGAIINRTLWSTLWKRTKSRASAQRQAGLSQNISGNERQPQSLGNEDGEARAEEKSNLQLGQSSGGSRGKHKIPALSHETATQAGSRVCLEKDRLLWGVQGS